MPYRNDLDAAYLRIKQLENEVKSYQKEFDWRLNKINWRNVMSKCKKTAIGGVVIVSIAFVLGSISYCVSSCIENRDVAMKMCKQKVPKGSRGFHINGNIGGYYCNYYITDKTVTDEVPVWVERSFFIQDFEIEEYNSRERERNSSVAHRWIRPIRVADSFDFLQFGWSAWEVVEKVKK
jgi:hypothetical protein